MWIIPSNIYHYVQDTEALISDLGLSSSPSDLFRDIDLFRDTEDIIQDILNAHS